MRKSKFSEEQIIGFLKQADEENLSELGQIAADFQAKALPVLRGFRVA